MKKRDDQFCSYCGRIKEVIFGTYADNKFDTKTGEPRRAVLYGCSKLVDPVIIKLPMGEPYVDTDHDYEMY